MVYWAGATFNASCADVTLAGKLAVGAGQLLGARDVAVACGVERPLFRRTNGGNGSGPAVPLDEPNGRLGDFSQH